MNSVKDIWEKVLSILSQQLTPTAMETWFQDCEPVEFDSSRLVLCTSSDFKQGIISQRFSDRIKKALYDLFAEEFEVLVITEDELGELPSQKGGVLPEINRRLSETGSAKQYRNLIGYTFGTGFGIGCVIDGKLNRGDNSCVETFCLPHSLKPGIIVEDGVAVRAVKRVYAERSGIDDPDLTPKDIFDIAEGKRPGNADAARASFEEMGTVAGEAMALAAQLIDGLVVIGGGITASAKYILPSLLKAMRGTVRTLSGDVIGKLQMQVYNLDDPAEFEAFARGEAREIRIHGTEKTVTYDPQKRIGVTISKIGASKAISIGAYDFALDQLDRTR